MTHVTDDEEQLEVTIGRAAREIRDAAGITLDQLATRAREHGLRWSTARVIEFEKGQMRVTLPMLLTVAQSLAQLANRPVALTDLIPTGSTWVRITEEWLTPRPKLREVLAGAVVALPQVLEAGSLPSGTRIRVVPPLVRPETAKVPAGIGTEDPLVPTLAEERAARRLGVRPRQVAMWSNLLWGSHLDAEVARLAGAEATPQARGHITRQLVSEIAAHIESHGDLIPRKESDDGDG